MKTELEELAQLALSHKRTAYPNVPEFALAKPKYSDKTANGLTKCVNDFLTFKGHYVVRINTTGLYSPGLKRFIKGSTKRGTADLHAIVNGRHISAEIKAGRDRQSEHQKQTQREITAAGGVYLLVRSFPEFVDWYNNFVKSLDEKKG